MQRSIPLKQKSVNKVLHVDSDLWNVLKYYILFEDSNRLVRVSNEWQVLREHIRSEKEHKIPE